MSDTCQTVRVKADNEQGFTVINETDFDSKVHEALDDAKTGDVASKPARKSKVAPDAA